MKKNIIYPILILGLTGLLLKSDYNKKEELNRTSNIENRLRNNLYNVLNQRNNLEKELIKEKNISLNKDLENNILKNKYIEKEWEYNLTINDYTELVEGYKELSKDYIEILLDNSLLMIELEFQYNLNKTLLKNIPEIHSGESDPICYK
jgi:septum formation inhibitor-activating ATPase MinD